ncbi:signal transduction histidine kinase [Sphaerotilus hippei]|uniref:histidine kinase n=1 Tax=Sphaerotilus hippei TaxID=744406 RepID=A0A318H0Y4_9BURK|nr:ATP-binding protein [Sphaerotilus hippei]PXW96524.1 signal transduction histidine kinase [Sphaerotilus hippei]
MLAVAVRNLYLNIYLTVVAVLLVFALVVGLVVRHYAIAERGRIETALDGRATAWAELIEKALPPVDGPVEAQRTALLSWSQRLGLPLALEATGGERLATSPMFAEAQREADGVADIATRIVLKDGRVLWIGKPSFRLRRPMSEPGPGPGRGEPDGRGPGRGPGDGFGRLPGPLPGLGPRWWPRGPWVDMAALLVALFLAVAAGSYPVVRRLTRRLERLQQGVETFGAGQLGHRVAVDGQDEVAALAESFNRAAQRVEDLVTSNRSMLANASHELRSPLARLKMAVEMLEITPAERRADLRDEIDRDIRELDALVEEVLLASRLDASTALAEVPVELAGLLAEEAARVGAEVDLEAAAAQVQVLGDERLLRRAVRNLLENAHRYGGDEVQAQLRLTAPGQVEIAVCDRGPGVQESLRERIFEPFYRLPGHAERAGGVGLGLSLVRQIVTRHGGRVSCEAREGGGSRFVIRLPLQAASVPSAAP